MLYIYAKTGHNYGLSDLRRCAYIAKKIKDLNPMMLLSDYRACSYASEYLDIQGAASIDVVKNIANVANAGDNLIIQTDELNEALLKDMSEFFSNIIVIGEEIIKADNIYYIESNFIDNTILSDKKDNYEIVFYFGDDDYNKELLKLDRVNMPLLRGYYFFLNYDNELKNIFDKIIDEEEYFEIIQNTKYLITSCEYSALESYYYKNYPILLIREDKKYNSLKFLKELNIPIFEFKSFFEKNIVNEIFSNYLEKKSFNNNLIDVDKIKSILN